MAVIGDKTRQAVTRHVSDLFEIHQTEIDTAYMK